jgi:anti-sigma factor RsiW
VPRSTRARHISDEDLVAYVDGDLPADRRAELAAHLRACGRCRGRLEAFPEAARVLREASPPVDDPAGRAAIGAEAAGADRTPRRP